MIDLKLLYFDGCPNVNLARRTLQKIGFQFKEVNQNNLPEVHQFKKGVFTNDQKPFTRYTLIRYK